MAEQKEKNKITIEDKDLIDSVLFLKQNKFMNEIKTSVNFESVKEIEDFYKEEVISTIKEKINFLKEGISELQKKGEELHLEGIQLLEIPLKVRLWKARPIRKELENIYTILEKITTLTTKLKKEYELKEIEKEKANKD